MHSSKDGRHTQDQQHTFTLDEEFVNGRHPACRALRLASAASNLRFPVHTRTHIRVHTRTYVRTYTLGSQSACAILMSIVWEETNHNTKDGLDATDDEEEQGNEREREQVT